jgi:hypothetical protein
MRFVVPTKVLLLSMVCDRKLGETFSNSTMPMFYLFMWCLPVEGEPLILLLFS